MLNGMRIHIRRWGTPGAPQIFLLHGWMDSSASFQFVVDAMVRDWDIMAPDWRGFGLSQWQHSTYWFPEYGVDLEALLAHFSPDQPATVVGHSMGGNVAGMYAGLRPSRIRKLINLDAFGVVLMRPEDYPERLGKWLDEKVRGPRAPRSYASAEDYAKRLMQANPRLRPEQAAFLSVKFSQRNEQGHLIPAADPWHRLTAPMLLHASDFMTFWGKITAPVLWVVGEESYLYRRFDGRQDEYRQRVASFQNATEVVMPETGHNLHHDQPERVARLIEGFIDR